VRFCGTNTESGGTRSTAPTWDNTPIDVNVAFPPAPNVGPDGNYPLIMMFHGYGGHKLYLSDMQHWLDKGYATFSMSDRGFHESCGSSASRTAAGSACDNGYIRLIDNRYEVRDAQFFAGELVDAGLVDPSEIGAIGGSYGGGMSMALGALKDRTVMPDGSLVPWTSPVNHTPISLAAAAPNIPWTDLAYSLAPNGSTLDYLADSPYTGPPGVSKQSLVGGLYISGLAAPGFYAPEGSDPSADITGWRNRLNAGEPYGTDVQAILDELTTNHSSYYIDDSEPPAPMLMSNGFTDDLFPVDETVRYFNKINTKYPNADLSLFYGDFGHPRAQGKDDVTGALNDAQDAWMDRWVKGVGPKPFEGVTAYTETCPDSAPSGGPYTAKSWASIAPGEIRFDSAGSKTIAPTAGSTAVAAPFNPVGGSACATAPAADQPGTATYRLKKAPAAGFTMMGAATVSAKFTVQANSEVAARLLDVAPDGNETLVDRGLWRPVPGTNKAQVFQLHPNGYQFAAGHVPKLELLPQDYNAGLTGGYGRPSDDQNPVKVKGLELRIPVLEKPGALTGLVKQPAPKILPKGDKLAREFKALPDLRPKLKGKTLKVKGSKLLAGVACPKQFDSCNKLKLSVTTKKPGKKPLAKPKSVAKGKLGSLPGGKTKTVKMKLTKAAKKYLAEKGSLKVYVKIVSNELADPSVTKAKAKK
jgi:dienelactone hydrolase